MTIFILIVGISLLIFIHELGHFLAAKAFGLYVEEFGFGFPPRLVSFKKGETRYSINLLPFGGFVKIYGERADVALMTGSEAEKIPQERSFASQGVGRRSIVIAAGVILNVILGWILFSSLFMIGASGNAVITQVSLESPAAIAGLKQGDQLLDFKTASAFIEAIDAKRGEEVMLRIGRGTETLTITATPDANPPEGRGALGVAITDSGIPKLPFFKAIGQGFVATFSILWAIIKAFGVLIAGIFTGAPVLESFVGPVGIFEVAQSTAGVGIIYLWQLIALISLNLAVLNALPFPALDGGRLLFLLIEKIKGSPIHPKREAVANAIGFSLLILLMVVVTVRDIVKLF